MEVRRVCVISQGLVMALITWNKTTHLPLGRNRRRHT